MFPFSQSLCTAPAYAALRFGAAPATVLGELQAARRCDPFAPDLAPVRRYFETNYPAGD